ncbi:MAG TPA: endolytic transglycosylase MltG, partial [Sulfurovum sp.]|nr:endolytic transglycosylase MltG [Sulfurovum sp.]
IIASIIQKESNNIDEMPLISSVIYNRLEKGMRLQMDGTLNYGKHSHTIVTSERIKTDTSLYNTYKHKGLPPAPLSSVSVDALKAACNPETSKYLFFMLTKDGTHVFADNYDEHLENVRAFKNRPKDENITNNIDTNKTSIENNTTSDSNTTSDNNATFDNNITSDNNISISYKRSVRKSSKSNKSKDSALE